MSASHARSVCQVSIGGTWAGLQSLCLLAPHSDGSHNRMSTVAVIPARGGSKGIPRKNVRLVAGKPLLAYTIEHALACPLVDRVAVSTDDPEIAAVAIEYGAEVIHRPPEISGDAASSESALLHALDHLKAAEGYEPELVVFLQATSPIRQAGDVQGAIETLQREQADSLFSAGPLHGFVWRIEAGELRSLSYDYRHRQRRQDAPEDLVENGSIYVLRPWVLRQCGNRLGGKIAVYRMSPLCSFQVDEPGDLDLISDLMAIVRHNPEAPGLSQVRLLVLDFDGVMTDNRVLVDETGKEAVWCDRADGWGIARVREAGVEVVVLSTEASPVVAARCRKLGVECIQGVDNKLASLQGIANQRLLRPEEIAYLGNDVNDLECMRWVGMPIAVADANPNVRRIAALVTEHSGGRGAVREVCDRILSALRGGREQDARGGAGWR